MKAFLDYLFDYFDEFEFLSRKMLITFRALLITIALCFCVIVCLSCYIQYQSELIEWSEYMIKHGLVNSSRFNIESSLKVLDVNDFDKMINRENEGSR